jgi:hypothetical protein
MRMAITPFATYAPLKVQGRTKSPTREIARRRLTRPRIRRAAAKLFPDCLWNEKLGVKDLTWLTPSSKEMTLDHWRLAGKVHWDAARQVSGIPGRRGEETLFLVVNAHHDRPWCSNYRKWRVDAIGAA